jgi:hypothetical protein
MIILDLYTNAVSNPVSPRRLRQRLEPPPQSMKVKSGYSEHLQELELVTTHLMPLVLNLLQLYGGTSKAVKLDVWSVDQFYVDCRISSFFLGLNSQLYQYTTRKTP